jgi:hypothetical protein
MVKLKLNAIFVCMFVLTAASQLSAWTGPWDGKEFTGRIAWSADGNFNDEDDWAASPVALAIFAEFGMQQKLLHFDYNCILPKTDAKWEKIHEVGVLGAAERYGFDLSKFHDCQKDLNAAVQSIADAINASSADDPLYFILAGPMEVPFLGIQQSDPAKRQYVYCISHNNWNDGYASGELVEHNKRDVIPMGVKWIQITDQNPLLATSRYGRPAKPEEWLPWDWMKDSAEANVQFLYERMQATTRADCSDAGMAWFLMTGNERPTPENLNQALNHHQVPGPETIRKTIRMEAENFRSLEQADIEYLRRERTISQRLSVQFTGTAEGRVLTHFHEPYTAVAGRYDIGVRYYDEPGGRCRYELLVNGKLQRAAWRASANDRKWHIASLPDVVLKQGDEIAVKVLGDRQDTGKLDYIELIYTGSASQRVPR